MFISPYLNRLKHSDIQYIQAVLKTWLFGPEGGTQNMRNEDVKSEKM
jgi:hypothetical protein